MIDQIPDLWPHDIKVKALSPVAILKAQAAQLRHRTKGLLEAAVKTVTATDGDTLHDFEITASALNGYKYSLFRVWHKFDFIYPVTIEFRQWMDEANEATHSMGRAIDRGEIPLPEGLKAASTPDEFIALLTQLLASSQTKSVLMSLISRINDSQIQSASPERPRTE